MFKRWIIRRDQTAWSLGSVSFQTSGWITLDWIVARRWFSYGIQQLCEPSVRGLERYTHERSKTRARVSSHLRRVSLTAVSSLSSCSARVGKQSVGERQCSAITLILTTEILSHSPPLFRGCFFLLPSPPLKKKLYIYIYRCVIFRKSCRSEASPSPPIRSSFRW